MLTLNREEAMLVRGMADAKLKEVLQRAVDGPTQGVELRNMEMMVERLTRLIDKCSSFIIREG